MPAATTKGYPYPVGTDRVMDGDNAIQALAEAIDGDANYTRAISTGQGPLVVSTDTPILWDAPSVNGCALTKTSTSLWTVTKPGIYVVTAGVFTTGFTGVATRNYQRLVAGSIQSRSLFGGENVTSVTLVVALVAGDTIVHSIFANVGTNVAAGTGFFHASRLGRT